MITTKEVKIEKTDDLTSEYIEEKLNQMGLDVLRWAITDFEDKFYILSLAVVDKSM